MADYNVVGMNASKIHRMKASIYAYIKFVNDALAKLDEDDVNPEIAFKGNEVAKEIKSYIEKVKLECGKLITNFNAFNDQLIEIEDQYKAYDTTNTSDVTAASSQAEYTEYTEKYADRY